MQNNEWWLIDRNTDHECLQREILMHLERIHQYFSAFNSKQETIEKILNNTAQRYSYTHVMHYRTAKLLADLGYKRDIYND